ncbi:MAG: DUF971 domain-containing protein [Ignavibacteriae bacterium]|nr:DUF971 domain-containing protein [Ignavibacteriota bacterium]MCB9217269.1 DUF971 domain-containing protein [Ignavibacteria bacterium]
MHPSDISISGGGSELIIRWSDHSVSTIPGHLLRKACSCSECRSRNRSESLSLSMLSSSAHEIREIDLLSSSKLYVIWNDGHDRSIYTFTTLREEFPPQS